MNTSQKARRLTRNFWLLANWWALSRRMRMASDFGVSILLKGTVALHGGGACVWKRELHCKSGCVLFLCYPLPVRTKAPTPMLGSVDAWCMASTSTTTTTTMVFNAVLERACRCLYSRVTSCTRYHWASLLDSLEAPKGLLHTRQSPAAVSVALVKGNLWL